MKKSKARKLPPIYVLVGDGTLYVQSASLDDNDCYLRLSLSRGVTIFPAPNDRIVKYVPAPARKRRKGK